MIGLRAIAGIGAFTDGGSGVLMEQVVNKLNTFENVPVVDHFDFGLGAQINVYLVRIICIHADLLALIGHVGSRQGIKLGIRQYATT